MSSFFRYLPSLFLLLSSISYASEKDPSIADLLELTLEELLNLKVVTVASTISETNLEAASTVELIKSKQWQQHGAATLWDAIYHLPGISVTQSSVAAEGLTYRGMALSPGTRGTAMMIDNVPINGLLFSTGFYHANNIGIGVLDRVEMIRGPGSALYGADAFQGVLSLHTKKAGDYENDVQASVGANDKYRGSFVLSNPINTDAEWLLAVDLSRAETDGSYFYDNAGGRLNSNRNTTREIELPDDSSTFTTGFNYDISDRVKLETTLLLNEMQRRARLLVDTDSDTDEKLLSFVDHDTQFYMFRTELDYELSNTLLVETQLFYWEGEFQFDTIKMNTLNNNTTTDFVRFGEENRVGLDVRLKHRPLASPIYWQLGYSNSKAKVDMFTQNSVVDPTSGHERDLQSLFGEIRIPFLNHKFDVLLGSRVDDYSDFGTHHSPRLAIIYPLSESSSMKLLYGNAFRAPSAAELDAVPSAVSGRRVFGNSDLNPETIDTFELVYMNNWKNRYLEAVVFRNEIEDGILINRMPESDPRFEASRNNQTYVNATELVSHGVEIKYGQNWGSFHSDFNLTYAKGRNESEEFDLSGYPTWVGNVLLTKFLNKPRLTVNLNGRVALDRDTYQKRSSSAEPSKLDRYLRIDVNISRRLDENAEIALTIKNLLNDEELYNGSVFVHETWLPEESRSFALRYNRRL